MVSSSLDKIVVDEAEEYYCKALVDLGLYPNYSIEVGDIDGDRRKEIAVLSTAGDLLKVFNIDGKLLFEKRLKSTGCWGTTIFDFADIDGDGKEELLVPEGVPGEARVLALDENGEVVRQREIHVETTDDYGVAVPMVGAFKRSADSYGICVAVAGGALLAFNEDFELMWSIKGLRKDFGHEFYFLKLPGKESELIAFITVDHIRYASPQVEGELLIVNPIGKIVFKKRVRDLIDDTHFDDVALDDFQGDGKPEVLVEKGFLMEYPSGKIVWNVSHLFDHGQWIAHIPNPEGPGRLIFITELWGYRGKSRLLGPDGETLWVLGAHRHTVIDWGLYPRYKVVPTRVHAIDWTNSGKYEFVFGEQMVRRRGAPRIDVKHRLKIFVLDPYELQVREIYFMDTMRKDFFYNGEVRSRATDVDGDGRPEYVFPRQDGKVMIIGKRV